MKNYFSGTRKLTRFTLKKEIVPSVIWISIIAILSIAVAAVFSGMDFTAMAALFSNPAMTAMMGPIFGDSTEAIYAASMLVFVAMAAGFMNVFLVVRNTRAEEEKGRYEVIRSLPVGKLSGLAATMIVAAVVNGAMAIVVGLGISLASPFAFGGSLLYGLTIGVCGMFFAAVTACVVQIYSSSKSASGMSMFIILAFYLIRGIGDVAGNFLSYISPLGLVLQMKIFVANNWSWLLLLLALILILCALAFYLNTKRDLDSGLVAAKPGRAYGSFLMKTPEGFLFKLMKNGILIWLGVMFLFGASYGSVLGDMETFVKKISALGHLIKVPEGYSLTQGFIGMIITIMVITATIPPLMAMLKLTGEERNHRYENILSKSVTRQRLMTAHLLHALEQSFTMLLSGLLGLFIAASFVMDTPITFGSLFNSFMVYLPAIWVFIGLAVFLQGVLPNRAALITYSYLFLSFWVIYLGPMLNLPGWVQYLTPLGYIPQLPMDTFIILPLIGLTVVSAGLTVVGYITYKKRDHRNVW